MQDLIFFPFSENLKQDECQIEIDGHKSAHALKKSSENHPDPKNSNGNSTVDKSESDFKQIQNNIENSVVNQSESYCEKIQNPKVKSFECTLCPKRFRSKDNQQLHMKSHKNKENNDGRNKNFESVKKSAVKRVSQGAPGFSCPSLGRTLDVRELIKKLKTCEVCSLTFDTKVLLKEHMELHNEKDSSKETEESNEIDDKFNPPDDTLKGSDDSTEKIEPPKAKKAKSSVTAEQTRETMKKFVCKVCSNNFSTKDHLDGHNCDVNSNSKDYKQSVHEGKKPLQCDSCKKLFSHKNDLTWHNKKAHKSKKKPIAKRVRKVLGKKEQRNI